MQHDLILWGGQLRNWFRSQIQPLRLGAFVTTRGWLWQHHLYADRSRLDLSSRISHLVDGFVAGSNDIRSTSSGVASHGGYQSVGTSHPHANGIERITKTYALKLRVLGRFQRSDAFLKIRVGGKEFKKILFYH